MGRPYSAFFFYLKYAFLYSWYSSTFSRVGLSPLSE